MRQRCTLTKEERLRGKKNIQELFEHGQSLLQYPLRVVYILKQNESGAFAKVLFSVPKRRFKKAHDRNLLRRRMKESYRQHKNWSEGRLILAFSYIANEPASFKDIEKAIQILMDRVNQRVNSNDKLDDII